MTIDNDTAVAAVTVLGAAVAAAGWFFRLEAKAESNSREISAEKSAREEAEKRMVERSRELAHSIADCRQGWSSADTDQQERFEKGAHRFAQLEESLHKSALAQAVTAEKMTAIAEKMESLDRRLSSLSTQLAMKHPMPRDDSK